METQIEHREKKDAQALRLLIENKDCWLTAIQINRCINSSDARKIHGIAEQNNINKP